VLTSKLIIQGNGATIEGDAASGTPEFRLIQVDSDSSVTLELQSLTLRG